MSMLYKEKIEILDCSNLINVQAFWRGVSRSLGPFVELTKMVHRTIDEAYREV